MKNEELHELVKLKVENLRPKLLDLSRRNPLLATKLSPRSNAHIRVVDELPDILFYKLNNNQDMRLIPLPDIGDDPKDEESKKFRDALSAARLTDERYQSDLEAVEKDADDYLDKARAIERALKDLVRAELGMPTRPKLADVNLIQHARNNNITPSYELPLAVGSKVDDKHADDDIQTLLLPKDLERKLNSVNSKCRTWIQETGINVLQVAYGFLEWSEPNQSDTSYAPLILSKASLEKRRTQEGMEFHLKGAGEDAEINTVLAEKMRLNFGIELPQFSGASVEEYLALVSQIAPKQIVWKVRRQVAIGVFPSARMAMYQDIDPNHHSFGNSEIVRSLLGGTNSEAASPFADEYNVDAPEIEKSVPYIVMDADSSQFSALVDIANEKNLAIEGPPGTGKSQTIVNAIAVALAAGKKVLFVAEKLAALNVVRARLESVGLGEFLLPLQAERSTREQVIESVRDRVEMRRPVTVKDFEEQLAQYRQTRQQLADYIGLITLPFGASGLTIHEIMSGSIATSSRLDSIPSEIIVQSGISEAFLHKPGIGRLKALGESVEKAAKLASEAKINWRESELVHADRFTVEEVCDLAARAARIYTELAGARSELPQYQIPKQTSDNILSSLLIALQSLTALSENDPRLHFDLLKDGAAEAALSFIDRRELYASTEADLRAVFTGVLDDELLVKLKLCSALCENLSIESLDWQALQDDLNKQRAALNRSRSIASALAPLIAIEPEAAHWNIEIIKKAHEAIHKAGRAALRCRNATNSDPSALPILQKLTSDGRVLQGARNQLGTLVSLEIDASEEVLGQTISVLRDAGFFSIFSSGFRRARAIARSLVLMDRFEKRDAVLRLETLLKFRTKERAFRQNVQAASAFGLHFQGVETDLAPFEALAAYLDFVQKLSGPALKSARNFLREAEWDDLEAVPEIEADFRMETVATLQIDLSEAERVIERRASALGEVESYLALFRNSASIRSAEVGVLTGKLDTLLTYRRALDEDQKAAAVLRDRFAGHRTPVGNLRSICEWARAVAPVSESVAAVIRSGFPNEAAAQIQRMSLLQTQADRAMRELSEAADISSAVFTHGRDENAVAEALDAAAEDSAGLFAHAGLSTAIDELKGTGIERLVAHQLASGVAVGLAGQMEALAIRKLARAVFTEHGKKLSRYPGKKLDELRANLARQDKEIIKLMQKELRWKIHANARPPQGNGIGRKSSWTQMALIDNEISKAQRFISVRDLTQRAGEALLELKPCWMMSPLAVAQYIPKDALVFDLCIIDEASQMPPEAAIGALLRCKQTVVVGDTNQLPPSSFFRKMIDDEEADEDDTVLNESILEMANATFRPARRLRWHYRSRHSGLIRFSNSLVYNDDLIVFPSANESMTRMGVEFQKVDGFYKSGTNAREAQQVVSAIIEFMSTDSNRSLGVVTLNQKQRDLIAEEFEYAVGQDRRAQAYVETWKEKNDGLEEFFIKNLENVQGDERDVIFIGTVYGPESVGARVAQRFGPINGLAGKRRLNVLFSRAKEKIVTFSSMTAADIVAEEDGNAGAYMLKRWLEYAAVGTLDGGLRTFKEPDSDFEVFVMDQIRAMGCVPEPQVGVAGYFIDIGVRHPEWPYGFILGVECDGASYHSAKSARDRDRLRQEVLERLGWHFHRIWSTDWFNNPRQEGERLRRVIADRMTALRARESEFSVRPIQVDGSQKIRLPEPVMEKEPLATPETERPSSIQVNETVVAVGDTVRVRYLSDDRSLLLITISATRSDPAQGIVHQEAPIARALLGAGEGEEVEVLSGSYVRPAVIESIMKRATETATSHAKEALARDPRV